MTELGNKHFIDSVLEGFDSFAIVPTDLHQMVDNVCAKYLSMEKDKEYAKIIIVGVLEMIQLKYSVEDKLNGW